MRTILLLSLINLSFLGHSQSHTFGTFNFSLGYDLGAHGVLFDHTYDNGTVSYSDPQDTSGAVTSMFRFDGHFNVLKFLSVGLHYRGGKYIEDPNNTQARGNHVSVYGIGLRLYPVNKDKFVWYIGTTIGGSKLIMNKEVVFIVKIPYQYKFKSPHYGFETGFNAYFAQNFGLNFGIGYSTQNFLMTDYTLNGEPQDLTNHRYTLLSKGIQLNLGITFHFGGK